MFGNYDKIDPHYGTDDKQLVSELELSNLIAIATNPTLGVQLDEEYLKKLRFILQKVAEEKIDRMTRQFKVDEDYEVKYKR